MVTNEEIFGGDGLIGLPIKENYFVYGDVIGDYATDDTFLISPGLGMRTVLSNQIIGAYFFSDYEGTNLQKDFWDVGPGVEWISPKWDAHFNCYFPTTLSKQSGEINFASQYDMDDWVTFDGHNQFDRKVMPLSVIGNGLDAELGYSFPSIKNLRSRVYIGTYFSWPDHGAENISGVTGGIEVPWTHYFEMSVANSYDTLKQYTAALRFSFIFGGHSTLLTQDVRDRLLDPIERHVGIIATGAGTYAQKGYKTVSDSELEYNNIYFVRPTIQKLSKNNGSFATYENPAELSQETLDDIERNQPDGVRIYVEGGKTYHVDNGTLVVHQGESLYGRSVDGTKVAIGDERPLFDEALLLEGNNTIDHLRVENNHSSQLLGNTYGIYISGAGYVNIQGSAINVTSSTSAAYGIYDAGSATITAENGTAIYVTASGSNFNAYGIYDAGSAGSITLEGGSRITVYNTADNGSSYGIYGANPSGSITLTNGSIDVSVVNSSTTATDFGAFGIASYSPISVANSNIKSLAQNTSNWVSSFGISTIDATTFADVPTSAPSSIPTVVVANSTIYSSSNGGINGEGYGADPIFMTNNISVSNSTLYANASGVNSASEGAAIRTNYGSITVTDSTLTSASLSPSQQGSYGISADPSSTTFPTTLPSVSVYNSSIKATSSNGAGATGIHSLGAITISDSTIYVHQALASSTGNSVLLNGKNGATITNSTLISQNESYTGTAYGYGGSGATGTVNFTDSVMQLTGHATSLGISGSSTGSVCVANGVTTTC